MPNCPENYNRSYHNLPSFQPTNSDEDEKTIDVIASYSTLSAEIIDSKGCYGIDCTAQTKDHFHGNHMKNKHLNTNDKEYKCSECSYQTNYKYHLKTHLNTHNDIKPFECEICKKRFTLKPSLKHHIRDHHSNTNEKEYKCSECSFQTNRKENLKRHVNTHNDIKPFECDICKKRFGNISYLNAHIRRQHSNTSEKEYKCSQCSYQTNLKGNLNKHLNVHSDIKLFECDICKKGFTLESHLKLHILNHHSNTSEKKYKCSECFYQTHLKTDLNKHLNTHKDIKAIECDICKKGFTLRSNLQLHILNHHSNTSEKEYKCSVCSYQTNRKGDLNVHLNTHIDIKPFECVICKKGFGRKDSLKHHIRNLHSNTLEKEHKCPKCAYQTNRKSHLNTHINTHSDIKAFECDICKIKFRHKPHLKFHIRNQHSNTNEKEYKCSECSYQTNRKEDIKRHLNTHNDIKPFECEICKKQYGRKGNLKLHLLTVHSNKSETEYKCLECSYQTNRKENLKRHVNTHNDIKPFACDICKMGFALKSQLNRHIARLHVNTIK